MMVIACWHTLNLGFGYAKPLSWVANVAPIDFTLIVVTARHSVSLTRFPVLGLLKIPLVSSLVLTRTNC